MALQVAKKAAGASLSAWLRINHNDTDAISANPQPYRNQAAERV
jgi:hypothetical protein